MASSLTGRWLKNHAVNPDDHKPTIIQGGLYQQPASLSSTSLDNRQHQQRQRAIKRRKNKKNIHLQNVDTKKEQKVASRTLLSKGDDARFDGNLSRPSKYSKRKLRREGPGIRTFLRRSGRSRNDSNEDDENTYSMSPFARADETAFVNDIITTIVYVYFMSAILFLAPTISTLVFDYIGWSEGLLHILGVDWLLMALSIISSLVSFGILKLVQVTYFGISIIINCTFLFLAYLKDIDFKLYQDIYTGLAIMKVSPYVFVTTVKSLPNVIFTLTNNIHQFDNKITNKISKPGRLRGLHGIRLVKLILLLCFVGNVVDVDASSATNHPKHNMLGWFGGLLSCFLVLSNIGELFCSPHVEGYAVGKGGYKKQVWNIITPVVLEWFGSNMPLKLLNLQQARDANIPREAYSIPTIQGENYAGLHAICTGIANAVFSEGNEDLVEAINNVPFNNTARSGGPSLPPTIQVTSKESLIRFLEESAPTSDNTDKSYLAKQMSYLKSSHNYAIEKAKQNEGNNIGIFKDIATKSERNNYKSKIMALIDTASKPEHERRKVMTLQQARANVLAMLEEHNLQYLFHLTVPQMMALVVKHVTGPNHRKRKQHVQDIIDMFVKSSEGKGRGRPDTLPTTEDLTNQELNEIMTMMDYIIKTKASIELVIPMLVDGSALCLNLFDKEAKKFRRGIYVMVRLGIVWYI